MRAQDYAAAEQTLRTELTLRVQSGWATSGLLKALDAQGRRAEAEALRMALAKAWPLADASLR